MVVKGKWHAIWLYGYQFLEEHNYEYTISSNCCYSLSRFMVLGNPLNILFRNEFSIWLRLKYDIFVQNKRKNACGLEHFLYNYLGNLATCWLTVNYKPCKTPRFVKYNAIFYQMELLYPSYFLLHTKVNYYHMLEDSHSLFFKHLFVWFVFLMLLNSTDKIYLYFDL